MADDQPAMDAVKPQHNHAKDHNKQTQTEDVEAQPDQVTDSFIVKGSNLPGLLNDWTDDEVAAEVRYAVDEAGLSEPTAIQKVIIPLASQQRDVLVVGNTGPGKVAAYVLPMLTHVLTFKPEPPLESGAVEPCGLILAPYKDVSGIKEEVLKIASLLGIEIAVCDEHSPHWKCQVVIVSPVSLAERMKWVRTYVALHSCKYIVIDGFDRMIHLTELFQVLDEMPPLERSAGAASPGGSCSLDRTTFIFSAAFSPILEFVSFKYLFRPVVVTSDASMVIPSKDLGMAHYCPPQEPTANPTAHPVVPTPVGVYQPPALFPVKDSTSNTDSDLSLPASLPPTSEILPKAPHPSAKWDLRAG